MHYCHNSFKSSKQNKTMASPSTISSPITSICRIFPNKTHIPFVRNLRCSSSCKTSIHSDQNHDLGQTRSVKLDRRNILLGLGVGGLAALASQGGPFGVTNAAPETAKKVLAVESSELPISLDSAAAISVIVPRPRKSRSKKEKQEEEEVLVIEGIEFVADKALKFDVHVNDCEKDALSTGPDKSEFAGSMVYLPHYNRKINTSLRLGITDLLENLGADDDGSIRVTLVPRLVQRPVSIGRIKIDYFA